MACPCEATKPCDEESLLAVAQHAQAVTVTAPELSLPACADCARIAYAPSLLVALLLSAILAALRRARRQPLLTLGLSASGCGSAGTRFIADRIEAEMPRAA